MLITNSILSENFLNAVQTAFRLRNDLYCVEWGVKLYSLTHSPQTAYKLHAELNR